MENNTINEPWYLKDITIFILLLPLSIFPFASILLIPLLYMKFRHLQNYANIDLKKMKSKRDALEEEIRNKDSIKDSIIEDITRKAEKDAAAKLRFFTFAKGFPSLHGHCICYLFCLRGTDSSGFFHKKRALQPRLYLALTTEPLKHSIIRRFRPELRVPLL